MGRGTRYLESFATEKEDSYRYRVEWDDYKGVRLIQIDSDGSESVYARK